MSIECAAIVVSFPFYNALGYSPVHTLWARLDHHSSLRGCVWDIQAGSESRPCNFFKIFMKYHAFTRTIIDHTTEKLWRNATWHFTPTPQTAWFSHTMSHNEDPAEQYDQEENKTEEVCEVAAIIHSSPEV